MNVIEYLSGLTGIVFDESVLQRIAIDRGVADCTNIELLSVKQRELMLADVLWTAYLSPSNIPSFSHQHGQFSTSTGSQNLGNKDKLYDMAMRIYQKWGDSRAELGSTSDLHWSL